MSITTPALNLSKDDVVFLATSGPTIAIRRQAAETLYQMGRSAAANEIRDALSQPSTGSEASSEKVPQ